MPRSSAGAHGGERAAGICEWKVGREHRRTDGEA
jgi:hypothetical protein